MRRYSPRDVFVDDVEEDRLKKALSDGVKTFSLKIMLREGKKRPVFFTDSQIKKIERAVIMGRNCISIRLTRAQLKANTEQTGGFLWTLAKAIGPSILGGIASAVSNKLTHKIMSKKDGSGLYVQKNGHCAKIQPVKGSGLYLSPHPRMYTGNGVFMDGQNIGNGLLLGNNSPFKDVPILNLLL